MLFALSLAWTLRRARWRPQAGAGDGQGKHPSSDETENGGLRDTRVADMAKITFADVACCDEAVEELREIAEFSRDPERFRRVGAKLPTGILPYGPPGTGKTSLAKALAGETGREFFEISASEFVEIHVGVGAKRARELFARAADSGAVVFIDEIDAIGRRRNAGADAGNDSERE